MEGLEAQLKALESLKQDLPDELDPSDSRRLEVELHTVQMYNQLIEGIVSTIGHAEHNVESMLEATRRADALLNAWVKILSYTEHAQKLLHDPQWQGISKDNELQAEREKLLEQKRAKERAEKERREREAAAMAQRQKQVQERRRLQDETNKRRIYGRQPTTTSEARARAIRQNRPGASASTAGTASATRPSSLKTPSRPNAGTTRTPATASTRSVRSTQSTASSSTSTAPTSTSRPSSMRPAKVPGSRIRPPSVRR